MQSRLSKQTMRPKNGSLQDHALRCDTLPDSSYIAYVGDTRYKSNKSEFYSRTRSLPIGLALNSREVLLPLILLLSPEVTLLPLIPLTQCLPHAINIPLEAWLNDIDRIQDSEPTICWLMLLDLMYKVSIWVTGSDQHIYGVNFAEMFSCGTQVDMHADANGFICS